MKELSSESTQEVVAHEYAFEETSKRPRLTTAGRVGYGAAVGAGVGLFFLGAVTGIESTDCDPYDSRIVEQCGPIGTPLEYAHPGEFGLGTGEAIVGFALIAIAEDKRRKAQQPPELAP